MTEQKGLFTTGMALILRMRMGIAKLRKWQHAVEREQGKEEAAVAKGEADQIVEDFRREMNDLRKEIEVMEHVYHLEDLWANKNVRGDFEHEKKFIEELKEKGFPEDKLQILMEEFNATLEKFSEFFRLEEAELERINNALSQLKK